MARPKRLYRTDDGRYYHLVGGKRKYIKVPAGMSQKQISKINIKNIINLPVEKRLKRKRKRVPLKYEKKVVPKMEQKEGLPYYFFQPGKKLTNPADVSNAGKTDQSLAELFLKALDERNKKKSEITDPYVMTREEREYFKKFTDPNRIPFTEDKPKKEKKPFFTNPFKSKEKKPESVGAPDLNIKEPTTMDDVPAPALETIISFLAKKDIEIQNEKDDNKQMKELAFRNLLLGIDDKEIDEYKKSKGWKNWNDNRYAQAMKHFRPTEFADLVKEYGAYGKGLGKGDGLYNDEIENLAKYRIKHFVPVVPADGVSELPKYIHRGMKTFSAVINTSPSTSDGSGNDGKPPGHWMAIHVDNRDSFPSVEFFDPLASNAPTPELLTALHDIANKMNPEKMFLFKQNQVKRQSNLSSNCGYHAVKFIDDRARGIPFTEATGFDKVVDDSRDGEKDIKGYIKKFKQYI